VVCRSVCHIVCAAKTAKPIKIPFGLRAWVGSWNRVLDGVQIPCGRGSFKGGGKGRPVVKYSDSLM